jgi:hypothetical protein
MTSTWMYGGRLMPDALILRLDRSFIRNFNYDAYKAAGKQINDKLNQIDYLYSTRCLKYLNK